MLRVHACNAAGSKVVLVAFVSPLHVQHRAFLQVDYFADDRVNSSLSMVYHIKTPARPKKVGILPEPSRAQREPMSQRSLLL